MQRRDVLKSAVAAAGLTILKSGTLRGQNAPSNKLNIALFGVWGRGTAHYNVLRNENVVAICDVNDNPTDPAEAAWKEAGPISFQWPHGGDAGFAGFVKLRNVRLREF